MHFVLWKKIIIQMLKMTKIDIENHLSHWIICVIRKFWHFMDQQKSGKFCYQKSAVSKYRHSDEKWACCYCLFPTSLKWLEYYDSAKLWICFTYHQLSEFVELHVTWQIIIIFRKKMYESIITIRIYLLYFTLFCLVLIWFLISISILSPRENT